MLWVGRRWNGYRLALKVPDVPWNHHPKFKVKDKNNFNHHPYYFLFRLFCVHMVAACSSWNFQWFVVILVITCVICILSSWTITAPVSFFFFFSFSVSISLSFIYLLFYNNLTGYETSTNAVSWSHATCTPRFQKWPFDSCNLQSKTAKWMRTGREEIKVCCRGSVKRLHYNPSFYCSLYFQCPPSRPLNPAHLSSRIYCHYFFSTHFLTFNLLFQWFDPYS